MRHQQDSTFSLTGTGRPRAEPNALEEVEEPEVVEKQVRGSKTRQL